MTKGWDGVSDFYEDDEPIEVLLEITSRRPDAITAHPPYPCSNPDCPHAEWH